VFVICFKKCFIFSVTIAVKVNFQLLLQLQLTEGTLVTYQVHVG